MAEATFAAGCFWGIEEAFRKVSGVTDVAVGYTGGKTEDPTYELVCSGTTGHAEAVRVEFDPGKVSFEQLLKVFFEIHDPTTRDRQGPDIGSQYRSALFFHDEGQQKAAEAAKGELDGAVTEIVSAGPFYRAEEYHQRYIEKKRQG